MIAGGVTDPRDEGRQQASNRMLSAAGRLAPVVAVGGIALCLSIVGLGAGVLLLGVAAMMAIASAIGHYGFRSAPRPHTETPRPRAIRRPLHGLVASHHHN